MRKIGRNEGKKQQHRRRGANCSPFDGHVELGFAVNASSTHPRLPIDSTGNHSAKRTETLGLRQGPQKVLHRREISRIRE